MEALVCSDFYFSIQVWISYAPVANVATVYYNVSEMKINWFSLVFFACSVIFGLPAFWIIDSLGLRTGVCFLKLFL